MTHHQATEDESYELLCSDHFDICGQEKHVVAQFPRCRISRSVVQLTNIYPVLVKLHALRLVSPRSVSRNLLEIVMCEPTRNF